MPMQIATTFRKNLIPITMKQLLLNANSKTDSEMETPAAKCTKKTTLHASIGFLQQCPPPLHETIAEPHQQLQTDCRVAMRAKQSHPYPSNFCRRLSECKACLTHNGFIPIHCSESKPYTQCSAMRNRNLKTRFKIENKRFFSTPVLPSIRCMFQIPLRFIQIRKPMLKAHC